MKQMYQYAFFYHVVKCDVRNRCNVKYVSPQTILPRDGDEAHYTLHYFAQYTLHFYFYGLSHK